MLARLRKLLAPPVFEDPEKTRAAAPLHGILWIALLLALANVSVLPSVPGETLPTALGIVFAVLALSLTRRGHVHAVSTAFVLCSWLTSMAAVVTFGGIRDPRVITFSISIAMAGLLVSARFAAFLTGLTIAAAGLLAVAETRGLLPPFDLGTSPIVNIWFGLSLSVSMLGALVFIATRDLHRALAAAREAQRKLQEKNKEIERFTCAVTHDLKSPLFTIRGYLGLVEQDLKAGDLTRGVEDLGRIHEAANQMSRLLEDLLVLSKAGEVELTHEETPLGELVETAVEILRGRLAESGAEVVVAPDLPAVRGDTRRLVQVMQNLLDNAAKYMGDQPQPRIEVGSRKVEDEPVFYVRDNGRGIAPQFHEKVFENFTRLDNDVEGTGIGLAHVRKVVEAHGGRIWVESEGEGRGSTFCFVLPGA